MENTMLPMANGGTISPDTAQGQSSPAAPSPQSVADPDATTTRGELTDASLPDARSYAGLVGGGVNAVTNGRVAPGINAVTGMVQEKPAIEIGIDLAADILGTVGRDLLGQLTGPAIGAGVTLGKELTKENPNLGRAITGWGVPAVAATIGSTLGPLGAWGFGTLAGYATNASLEDGILGDMTDSRAREKDRDTVESKMGLSYGDTAMMSRADTFGGLPSERDYGFGLTDAVSSTTTGNISKAATNALGDPKSLGAYAKSVDLGEFDGDNDNDSAGGGENGKGEGAGHGDRDKGEGGLGGY